MPKSRYLKGFGVVVFLIAIGCIFWSNEGVVGVKSGTVPHGTISPSQDSSLHRMQDAGSDRRLTRGVNAESRVRSLLQIAPGEVGNIRIPFSGFSSLVTEELEKKFGSLPLIPLTREQAIHGLEEILRKGDSLGSRVDAANGKITWQGDGIVVNGEVTELGQGARKLDVAIEGAATNGMFHEGSMAIQGYSFFLVRAPDSDAGGVLLVFGEETKRENK